MAKPSLTEAQLATLQQEFSLILSPAKLQELLNNPNSEYYKSRANNEALKVAKKQAITNNLEIEKQNALIEKQLKEAAPNVKKETQLQRTARVMREYKLNNTLSQKLVADLKKLQDQSSKLQDKLNTLLVERSDILQKIGQSQTRIQKLDERSKELQAESKTLQKQTEKIADASTQFQKAKTPQEQIQLLGKLKKIIAPGKEANITPDQYKQAIKIAENNQTRQKDIAKENTQIEKDKKEEVQVLKNLTTSLNNSNQGVNALLGEFKELNRSIKSIEAKLGLGNNSKDASHQEWMSSNKFNPTLAPSDNKKKTDDENTAEYKSPSPFNTTMSPKR